MKLYRVIPIELGECITEDAFYKLGYIGVSKHHKYFAIQNESYTSARDPLYNGEKGIFFFTNPWDAVQCSWWVNYEGYTNDIVQICEYDFPDEIINKSVHGKGYYKGAEVDEIKIPYSVLETTGTFETTVSPELSEELKKLKKEMYLESAELYGNLGENYSKEFIIKNVSDDEVYNGLHNKSIERIERFMKSPFITGNMFTVTSKNRHWIDIDHEYLVNNSCGILTYENSNGWISEKDIPKDKNNK